MAELRTDIDILIPEDIHLSDLPNINLVEIRKKYFIVKSSGRNPFQAYQIQCVFNCLRCDKQNIRTLKNFRKNQQLLCRNCLPTKRKEYELRDDIIDIDLADVPQPHFAELNLVSFTKQYFKSKRPNGNFKQGSKIFCNWVCECGCRARRALNKFRKNTSLLCLRCSNRQSSKLIVPNNIEKYSRLGKLNWSLSIGAWAEKNGNPMHDDQIKEKIKQANLERYGVENTLRSEKLTRHVDWKAHAQRGLEIKRVKGNHPSSVEVIEKFQQTMANKSEEEINAIKQSRLDTWHKNHDTPEKVRAIFECPKKIQGHICCRFGEMFYQSQYEKNFIQVCHDDARVIKLSRGPNIRYILEGSVRHMFPDFELHVSGQRPYIVEIKSTYTAANDPSDTKLLIGNEYAKNNNYASYIYLVVTGASTITNLRNHLNNLLELLCGSQK